MQRHGNIETVTAEMWQRHRNMGTRKKKVVKAGDEDSSIDAW